MGIAIGAVVALSAGIFATVVGLDRNRAFYPVVTIVVASYYVLFAAMGGSTYALVVESLIGAMFLVAAVVGFRWSLWVAAAALAAHGLFDGAHRYLVTNPGVPDWWPEFCLAYDVTAAAYLAWLLRSGRYRKA